MTLRFPLGVRISDGTTDRHVTRAASNLRFKKTANGGFHSASVTLNLDPTEFPDLGAADRTWVYGPDGRTLWEGFLDNPGATDGEAGVGFDLTATGTVVLAEDRSEPVIYIDKSLDRWEQGQAPATGTVAAVSASAGAASDPSVVDTGNPIEGLLLQFNPNQPLPIQANVQINYEALRTSSMTLGCVSFRIKSGSVNTAYRDEMGYAATTGPFGNITGITGLTITTTPTGPHTYAGGDGTLPLGQSRLILKIRRAAAAGNVGNDDGVWSLFYDVAVQGHRYNLAGALVPAATMSATPQSVRADQVVVDLLSRCLPGIIDLNASTVEATTFPIDQLAYYDGVTAGGVLDDLSLWEPDMVWEFLERTAAGYRFNYRAWPTSVRYEVSARDGYAAPGADFDLCNRIAVKWVDAKGRDQTTVVTAASAPGVVLPGTNPAPTVFGAALSALEQAGRIRDAEPVPLSEGRGSAANALQLGQQVLATKVSPPKAATVRVRRPIVDLLRGGTAMPYELEPGYLCRVRETGDVLRVTEVDVDATAGEAVLTLGSPQLTTEQRIARLARVAVNK